MDDFNSLPKSSLDKLETLVEELNKKYLNMVQLFQAEEKKNNELTQEHEELKMVLENEIAEHA
jgi:hypothetical protein